MRLLQSLRLFRNDGDAMYLRHTRCDQCTSNNLNFPVVAKDVGHGTP